MYDINAQPIWDQVYAQTLGKLEKAIKRSRFDLKVVKTSFKRTCLQMRQKWASIKEIESDSSVSVVSKSGQGSFGSGEAHQSPAFGMLERDRKRNAKSERKTSHLKVKKQLNFNNSDQEGDVDQLSFKSGTSNITATPKPTPRPDEDTVPQASVSLSSEGEEVVIPPCMKKAEDFKPRYIPFEEEKADTKSEVSKKSVKVVEPPKEIIKTQAHAPKPAPKHAPKPATGMFSATDAKLAQIESKFAKKQDVSIPPKITKSVMDGQRKVIEYEEVASTKTVKIVKLADTKEMITFTAQQATLRKDMTALYDFVLEQTAKWEDLNKVRTINVDKELDRTPVTDPRAPVASQLEDITTEVLVHREQIRDACLTIRGWDAKISQCLDSLDEINRKFLSNEAMMTRFENARSDMQVLIAGQKKLKEIMTVIRKEDWDE